MLKHSSRHVQDAASIELAKVCPNVEKLLEFIEKDHRRCYQSLSRVNIDRSDTEAWKQHSKRMIELIKASPALLKIYINELYESIKNFTEQLEPYPEQSDQFDELFLIPIACELVEEMPSAFFVELDEMSYKENLQKALLCTSKQHDYRQRNACIKLLSTLGEFTVEICELLIDGLIESPTTQAACLDSIKYFRKPNGLTQRDMAVQQVDHVIKQFESTREPLPSQLHKLRSALLELESAGKFLEEVLSELESRQAPLKSAEKELKPILIHLKPILEQWEPAVLQLAKHLRSPSLNKRWGTALLFERLVQCNVISARRVQHLLTDTIEDSHSNNKLWLHQDNTSQSSYICVGNLNHMLCKLLMRMSSIEETSTEVKVYEIRNRLLEDFDAAETSARFASCVNLDEDSLDECESELEHSKPVEKQVKPTEIRPESANKSTKQTESHQRPSSHRKESARAEQRPKSSQESIPESSICNIL
ncbi:unnamed protein product [Rotaria sp. Silwood2]|nr:unnamed protein product [Rotaria sp. Silwood2]